MKIKDELNEWNQFIYDGNLDSLSVVYFHHYDLLFTYGMKHTSDRQSVEDAIQDVFVNLIKSRKNIGIVQNQSGYLVSSFRRQLFINLNKMKKTLVTDNLPEEHFDFYKSNEPVFKEEDNSEKLNSIISECISKLSSKQREIIYLRFDNGDTYEEIARMLQISVDSCYKSVYRSIRTIRNEVIRITGKGGNIILLYLSRVTKQHF
jgi:RNA polymerase sigma factor (sigma-70 family)